MKLRTRIAAWTYWLVYLLLGLASHVSLFSVYPLLVFSILFVPAFLWFMLLGRRAWVWGTVLAMSLLLGALWLATCGYFQTRMPGDEDHVPVSLAVVGVLVITAIPLSILLTDCPARWLRTRRGVGVVHSEARLRIRTQVAAYVYGLLFLGAGLLYDALYRVHPRGFLYHQGLLPHSAFGPLVWTAGFLWLCVALFGKKSYLWQGLVVVSVLIGLITVDVLLKQYVRLGTHHLLESALGLAIVAAILSVLPLLLMLTDRPEANGTRAGT